MGLSLVSPEQLVFFQVSFNQYHNSYKEYRWEMGFLTFNVQSQVGNISI